MSSFLSFFGNIITTITAGGPGAVIVLLILMNFILAFMLYKFWSERKEVMKDIKDLMQQVNDASDERVKMLTGILDRYHEDRSMIVKALSDVKESLAKIMGKLW